METEGQGNAPTNEDLMPSADDQLGADEEFAFEGLDEDPNPPEEEEQPNRYQRLANERREAQIALEAERRHREMLERQLAENQRNSQASEDDLDPDDRWRKDTQTAVNAALAESADARDSAAFDRLVARNPLAAKMAEEVEAELLRIRSQGQNATREGVLNYLVGQKALKAAGKPTNSQRRTAQRVSDARGEPGGRRPTAPAPAAPADDMSIEAISERLRGVPI